METTTNEQVVLKAIVEFAHKSSDTGVEYLLDEVVSETGMSQLSVQGVLSSLQKKGYIECFGDECYFDGMITENAENWYQEQQEQEDNNNQNEEEEMETTKKEELIRVQRDSDNKYNLINAQGKLFFDKWFECIGYFDEGLARVQIESNGKFNLITENGKFLSEQWYEWIGDFENGLALVQRERENPRFNYIDKDGKIISNEWFRYVDYFDEYDLAVVERTNGELCKIDKNGNIVNNKQ